MKIGIVGSSEAEITTSINFIMKLMKEYPSDTEFVSGGAKGIDTAVDIACQTLGRKLTIFLSDKHEWASYSKRNLKIARYCDEVISIALPFKEDGIQKYCYHCKSKRHQKTAGCWTARKCKEFKIEIMG